MTPPQRPPKAAEPPDAHTPAAALRSLALQALLCADPSRKATLATELHGQAAALPIEPQAPAPPAGAALPGRPPRPLLVPPQQLPRRSPHSREGLAALLHAVAHIEFNAINLALDAAWRFDGLPPAFRLDWLRVAAEEALHFTLLRGLLNRLGHDYGDFDAHDGLWQMCERTARDACARMALVPRTLEARGLDATPPMQARLRRVGSPEALAAVAVLDTILRDEIGHVAIGNHWYRWLCAQRGLDPLATYPQLARRYRAPRLKPPFNLQARMQAGFLAVELAAEPSPLPTHLDQTTGSPHEPDRPETTHAP